MSQAARSPAPHQPVRRCSELERSALIATTTATSNPALLLGLVVALLLSAALSALAVLRAPVYAALAG